MKKFIMITPCFLDSSSPLMALVNRNVINGEEIRVITITPESARAHEQQIHKELAALQEEKGFICRGVETIPVADIGDTDTSMEIFRSLMPYFEEGDTLYACLTYGITPMAIAEFIAIKHACHMVKDITIGAVVYGDSDITPLIWLDELSQTMAKYHFKKDRILEIGLSVQGLHPKPIRRRQNKNGV